MCEGVVGYADRRRTPNTPPSNIWPIIMHIMLKEYTQCYECQLGVVASGKKALNLFSPSKVVSSQITFLTAKSTFAPVIRVQNYSVVRGKFTYIEKESYFPT